jgi:Putative peptidoglycan binding domain
MTKLLQIGQSTAAEIGAAHFGHIACTLGGVNYESTSHTIKGGSGCVRGSAARGAAHRLFKHQFFMLLPDAQAKAAQKYADGCVGQPYVLGSVPSASHGGDCSGFVSGIICVAKGKPQKRLFSTATWLMRFDDPDLGFKKGLDGGGLPTAKAMEDKLTRDGVLDRPFPGTPVGRNDPRKGHVRWIQARLNFAAKNKHAVLGGNPLVVDGDYGEKTEKVVVDFQKDHGLEGLGMCGPKTWPKLNAIR